SQDLLDEVGSEKSSLHVRAGAEKSRGKLPIDAGAVVPIALGKIEREIITIDEQRASSRALWNNAQRNRFRCRQMRRCFVEINLTGRADAFDVSPVGCEIQVGLKNFVFRVMAFQFERANNL